jgi:WhiB family redox-sensing transcriptional regulator
VPPKPQPLCRQFDPELWFPVGHGPAALRDTAQAKQVCGLCPIRWECLQDALAHATPYGIWGGQTEEERRATLRRNPTLREDIDAGDRTHLMEALASKV